MKFLILDQEGMQIRPSTENARRTNFESWNGQITRVSESLVIARNPLTAPRAFFVLVRPTCITISSCIADLIDTPFSGVDYTFVMNSILNEDRYDNSTVWQHIQCVPPGSSLTIRSRGGLLQLDFLEEIEAQLGLHVPGVDPMHILLNEVTRRAEAVGAKSISVNFSGGCDSTGLLMAARSIKKYPISAVTWTCDGGSAHEDLIASRAMAVELGVRHVVLDIDPDSILSPLAREDLTPNVSTSLSFHPFRKILHSLVLENSGPYSLVLNGHGGDHLYLDPVPIEVVFDACREAGLKHAARVLHRLARLSGENHYRLLMRNRNRLKGHMARARFLFNTEALQELGGIRDSERHGSAKQIHRTLIRQAIYQNSTAAFDGRLPQATPFTCPEIIAAVWSAHPEVFFDAGRNRIPFRDSVRNFSESASAERRGKGHVTGAFQKALKKKAREILSLVANGRLSALKIINTRNVMDAISTSISGYGGLDPLVLKIICFELMMEAK